MTLLRRYLVGLAATFVGAWVTKLTHSMLPLAMGAAVTLLCTLAVVKRIWTRCRRQ